MPSLQTSVLLILCLSSLGSALIGRTQSAAVEGTLTCDGRPASNVLVKLYDDDSGPDLDDLLDSGDTNANGQFMLRGSTDEILTINPKINIYHDCDDGLPCQRRITIYVPKDYVTSGSTASKVYNAGTIELSGKFSGESRDCLHRK